MVEWKKCRKKPIVVWFREVQGEVEVIKTREGTLKGYRGKDFIIKGVRGEIYPIGKDIFHRSYDVLEEVCECGHLKTDHEFIEGLDAQHHCNVSGCPCADYEVAEG